MSSRGKKKKLRNEKREQIKVTIEKFHKAGCRVYGGIPTKEGVKTDE